MPEKFQFFIESNASRLDSWLAENTSDLSRSAIKSLIQAGHVLVNNKSGKPSQKLKPGDVVLLEAHIQKEEVFEAEDIPIDIVYEDTSIAVVNKSPGMVVHPGAGNRTGTLMQAAMFHLDSMSGNYAQRPGIVHRLDKDTSGLIVLAKTDSAHEKLAAQFEKREVQKIYQTIAWGKITESCTVEGQMGRVERDRKLFQIVENNGRYSITDIRPIELLMPFTFVECKPGTGRTHQIRVHLKHLGHPILADIAYGGGEKRIKSFHSKYAQMLKRVFKRMPRVALHAKSLTFTHPETEERVSFSAELPRDMRNVLDVLRGFNDA